MAESSTTVSLKLLIDTKGKRVLFAEAGKDFVDFLFQILTLPAGTVIRLLREQQMVGSLEIMGSLPNLYESVENLNDSYLQPNKTKDSFLNPLPPFPDTLPLLAIDGSPAVNVTRNIYICTCRSYPSHYSDNSSVDCPSCCRNMTTSLSYVAAPAAAKPALGGEGVAGGVVKGLTTYMVMDDLVVTPLSTISSITLLNKFKVQDVSALEEKVVYLGADEGVKLLNASLKSKTVLTDVFLNGIN